ncbi:MAG: hypothetical protein C4530_11450 [Desulfobacteraceae bacterium]|nr:MAG: hypothetical protein C4530_11450 [Desulfobacteraceae bacterium]
MTDQKPIGKALPVLRGVAKGGSLIVWCPFCNTFHSHGWKEGQRWNRLEHRVSHCVQCRPGSYTALYGSPFTATGYMIGELEMNRQDPNSIVARYLEEHCRLGKGYRVHPSALYEDYRIWAERTQTLASGKITFFAQIQKLHPHIRRKRSGTKDLFDGLELVSKSESETGL